ncbi:MAG TPA: PQQ-dependent sugar dehydrogenase [Sphingomicrobium sp.]|nr:PQQ-dependent sugar dehydrogenase [Sphingomicrobium sp.]
MNERIMQVAMLALALVACSGSAPAGGAAVESADKPFTTRAITNFDTPWAMSFLPGSGVPLTKTALISEKNGKLWLVDVASGKKQAVGGVPAVRVAGQGGLGDVVADPGFAGNHRVYLSFVEAGEGDTSGAALGYGTLVLGKGEPRIDGFKIIWRQVPKVTGNGHFSHRMAFAPDGSIFLSSGERQKFDPAQAMDTNLGKILHLTAEGLPAPGNPWAEKGGVAAQFWDMGHRNVLGLAFAPDGRLWAIEMGPKGGDELNLIEKGKNYGWPIVSNGSHYDGRDIPDHPTRPEFAAPKLWWNPSISPAGLIIYSGNLFPQWKGDAIFGALSGTALVRADINGANATKADYWPMGARIREVEQGPDGEVYLLEDGESGGRLLRLDPVRR